MPGSMRPWTGTTQSTVNAAEMFYISLKQPLKKLITKCYWPAKKMDSLAADMIIYNIK